MNHQSNIRIVTYNILSSHLAPTSLYTACKPENLDQSVRLIKVKEKLKVEIAQSSIICLQEISILWAGQLHTFFANNGYYLITGLYGPKKTGYMGVGIAIPIKKYEICDVDITCIADTKQLPQKSEQSISLFNSFVNKVKTMIINIAVYLKLYDLPMNVNYLWETALGRPNQMVCTRLMDLKSSKEFVLGTYHFPCIFELPAVMVIQAALSAQHIHRYAKGLPYVYVGDFNIKPYDLAYQLITEGSISSTEENYPISLPNDSWTPHLERPLRSAYRVRLGREPDFTNYVKVRDDPIFMETLDYLFYSSDSGIEVTSVLSLPSRERMMMMGSSSGPLPNAQEPSDHLLLAADFQ